MSPGQAGVVGKPEPPVVVVEKTCVPSTVSR
jgi:hypothetical protein